MKFGISEVVRPYSTEKIMAEKMLYMFGEVKNKVEKVSDSIKIEQSQQPLAECIKAIKQLEAGNSDYTAIEFFTDKQGIIRMNVCYMRVVIWVLTTLYP